MRHLTLIFASLLAISSTGCVTPYGCGMGCGLGNPYGACVADCNQYGGLPSPAEYRRQRRFYRDLNRFYTTLDVGGRTIRHLRLGPEEGTPILMIHGFGADLGAEKFIDIKCRASGLRPSAVVVVASAATTTRPARPRSARSISACLCGARSGEGASRSSNGR